MMLRKESEEELKKSEARYRLLADNVHDVIWTMDLAGHFTYVSPSVFQLRGYTPEEIMHQTMMDALTPNSAQIVLEGFNHFYETGEITSDYFELEQPCKDGSTVWTEVNFAVLRDKDGKPESILGVSRDITARKKAEDDSRLLGYLVESSDDAIIGKTIDGTIFSWNGGAQKIYGYDSQEVIGKNISILAPSELKDELPNILERVKRGEKIENCQTKRMRKDGSVIDVSITVSPIKDSQGNIVGASTVARDITEDKKAEEEMENTKNYFETLMTSVLSGIIVVDSETHEIVDANPAALGLIGAPKKEVVGKVCHKFICPAEIGKCPITDLGQTVDKAERTIITKDGVKHPIIKSVVKAKLKGRTLLVENFVDISALKKTENSLQMNQKRLELMNEKLKVVGGLTRHDVRNKLAVIKGDSYLLKKKFGANAEVAKYSADIDSAVTMADRLFEFSSLYERIGAEEQIEVDVKRCFDEAAALFPNLGSTKVVNECEGLTVVADSLLRQLFYNLIDNSLKHGEKVTQIKLHFTKEVSQIKLFYEDDGVGVPEANKLRLFHEGFTTGGGTGLGLTLVKKMVEVYGWNIKEEGEQGKGAKFVLTIPADN